VENQTVRKVKCLRTNNGTKYTNKEFLRFCEEHRIFGCPAYVHIPSEERSKLDSKSKKCIFIGFKKEVKGYKLWDLVLEKVVISRDVVFDEKSMLKAFKKEDESQVVGSCSYSGKSIVQVDLDEVESQLEKEPHNMKSDRPKYGFKDFASYCLLISSGDPSAFQESIDSSEKDKWMEAMVEEMESLNKNKTRELSELLKRKKP